MMVVEGFQVHTIPIRQFMKQIGMVSHDFGENDLVRTTPPIVIHGGTFLHILHIQVIDGIDDTTVYDIDRTGKVMIIVGRIPRVTITKLVMRKTMDVPEGQSLSRRWGITVDTYPRITPYIKFSGGRVIIFDQFHETNLLMPNLTQFGGGYMHWMYPVVPIELVRMKLGQGVLDIRRR